MPRYRLTLAYDGTDFFGWQKQEPPAPLVSGHDDDLPPYDSPPAGPSPGVSTAIDPAPTDEPPPSERSPEARDLAPRLKLRTVQQALEVACLHVFREPVIVMGASRTDSGVHAWHQTAAFTVPDDRRGPPDERLAAALNARLPDDVLVRAAARIRDDFNPIGDCLAKGYRYAIHTGPERPLWDRRYVKHLWKELDDRAMDHAAGALVGTHDFAAFAAAGHGRLSTVRTVLACSVTRPALGRVHIHVAADGFLWNMVRIIAGTLVEVGLGKKTRADVEAALASRDRRLAGPTMRPEGLCLMWARYPEDPPAPAPADLDLIARPL